ncbi:UNVERIFIED_CONTAM: hypothetical protein PYX00_003422 [Menopon gallinae]|uniref:HMG box domain-containing protein n=1 Tax=Menopon gallinae TaxID=328185 RepID=A0AAW2I1J9_9NEOP
MIPNCAIKTTRHCSGDEGRRSSFHRSTDDDTCSKFDDLSAEIDSLSNANFSVISNDSDASWEGPGCRETTDSFQRFYSAVNMTESRSDWDGLDAESSERLFFMCDPGDAMHNCGTKKKKGGKRRKLPPFIKYYLTQYKKYRKTLGVIDIAREAGARWRCMTVEEKAKYYPKKRVKAQKC